MSKARPGRVQLPALTHSIHGAAPPEGGAEQTVVLLHGFPDTPSVWTATLEHLVGQGRRVILVTLPGFEEGAGDASCPPFDEVVGRLQQTLVVADAVGATLVGHDWGAIFGYLLLQRHPQSAGRFVALEIGCAPRSPWLTAVVLAYHGLLNMAWVLGRPLGDLVVRWFCRLLPWPRYPGRPTPCARNAWLYRQAWREGGSDGPWPLYYRNSIAGWSPRPGMPFLFIHGAGGPAWLRFHSEEWCRKVTSEHPLSRTVALPGGHWCFVEHSEDFHRALDGFLGTS